MLQGIDISSWQKNMQNFGSDVDFVILKATEGVGMVDKYCDKFYQQAKKDGKLVGVYHFARPDLGNTAEAEATYFVNNIKGYINDAILVLDWEPYGNSIANVDWAKSFLDKVKELTGVKPLIYMSSSVTISYNWSSVVQGDYGLWVACYGANTGTAGKKPNIKWWNNYAMWQYTSRGHINGYNGDVDLDYFYGSKEAWLKYANAKIEPVTPAKIKYRSHIQTYGWQEWKRDGEISGTTGESKRLEAIQIDYDKPISAKAHIQDIGWVDYGEINKDTIIGTTGESKRLECLCLKGDFKYRVHIQDTGWTCWTNADGICTLGSVGQSLRIEAIEII